VILKALLEALLKALLEAELKVVDDVDRS